MKLNREKKPTQIQNYSANVLEVFFQTFNTLFID